MNIYIKGMGNISPQQTWDGNALLVRPLNYPGNKLSCVEPDYTAFVDAKQIRRMSRIIKMGAASATMALREAGTSIPDGIITATGYGCLDDTGIFLTKLVENKEQALSPTPFIQSTHNTIGSQIALLLQCQGYNQTYTQGSVSFEGALLDAILQLSEFPDRSILVGGADEITTLSHNILSRFGIFRNGGSGNLDLFEQPVKGTINGEGAAFFVLSGKSDTNAVRVKGVTTLYKPERKDLAMRIEKFLKTTDVKPIDIDLILLGKCGDQQFDKPLDAVTDHLFPTASVGLYKHLCGEYPVASAFALWLGASILKQQRVPELVFENDRGRDLKNILIYNQYFGIHHSFILLQA